MRVYVDNTAAPMAALKILEEAEPIHEQEFA